METERGTYFAGIIFYDFDGLPIDFGLTAKLLGILQSPSFLGAIVMVLKSIWVNIC